MVSVSGRWHFRVLLRLSRLPVTFYYVLPVPLANTLLVEFRGLVLTRAVTVVLHPDPGFLRSPFFVSACTGRGLFTLVGGTSPTLPLWWLVLAVALVVCLRARVLVHFIKSQTGGGSPAGVGLGAFSAQGFSVLGHRLVAVLDIPFGRPVPVPGFVQSSRACRTLLRSSGFACWVPRPR